MKTIGERIRQARDGKSWSQQELAAAAGFSHQSAIANLENRATGSGGRRIWKIAEVLGVPVEWLLSGPDCDDTDIPWKVRPSHGEPVGPPRVQEPLTEYFQEPIIVRQAVELLRSMSSAGQQEAIRYLRYLAKLHAFPPSAERDDPSVLTEAQTRERGAVAR